MDYIEWSREYAENADLLQNTIDKLKKRRACCITATEGVELDEKIKGYRNIRYEMLKTADILMKRAAG